MKIQTRIVAVLFGVLVAAVCASAQDKTTSPGRHSGFLGDYSALKPVPDRPGTLLFLDKSGRYAGYTRIMFEPSEVYLAPEPGYKGIQPDTLKRMTDGFMSSFTRALEPEYQVVTAPGPDVFRVRAAITGVHLVQPPAKPTDLISIKAAVRLARSAAGAAPVMVELSAEVEVLDANGRRVLAAVATRKGEKTLNQADQLTWSDFEAISDYWARAFRRRLDEVRGLAP